MTFGDGGLNAVDGYAVRILAADLSGYMSPDEWRAVEEMPTDKFTVQNGDVIVRGHVEDAITSSTDVTSKYTDSFVVSGCYDNRRGVPFLKHIKILGR